MSSLHCCGTSPQSPAQGGITVEGGLEQLDGDAVRSDSLFVCQHERMAPVSSCIVGWTSSSMFSGHW